MGPKGGLSDNLKDKLLDQYFVKVCTYVLIDFALVDSHLDFLQKSQNLDVYVCQKPCNVWIVLTKALEMAGYANVG